MRTLPTLSPEPMSSKHQAAGSDMPLPATANTHPTRTGRVVLAWIALLLLVLAAWMVFNAWNGPTIPKANQNSWVIPSEFNGDRAFNYLQQVVAFGPRPSGSEAMLKQQAFLKDFFESAGAEVEMQRFDGRHPESGQRVEMTNIIARFRPTAAKRYLLCAHYDTRPFPDRDSVNRKGLFVGANDGASGAAALMEFTHHISTLPASVGVDLVLFDGEELIYDAQRDDDYFLGSTYFANNYVREKSTNKAFTPYVAGVLLDMIGDRELQLFYERNSWNYAHDITVEIWSTAKRLKIDAFEARIRHLVRDDHLPLNQIAKIPTTDLIDFDYPRPGFRHQSYWHTTEDTADKCSGQSIVAVLYVLHTWISKRG